MTLKKYMEELTELNGVSGSEEQLITYMCEMFGRYGNEVSVDNIGNVICKLSSGKKNAKRLMLFAHMDEIGFIVRKIEDNGYIRIERMGGVSTQILPGLRIVFQGDQGNVTGLIGTPSHHFIRAEDKFKVPSVDALYVDIGASTAEEVQSRGIDVGTTAVFENCFLELGNNIVSAKALDDRAALAILIDILEKLSDKTIAWDVYFVAAVMEEFNIRGIMPAVRRIQPDAMIGIDITPACDTPDMDYNRIALGKGPTLTYMNFHGRGTLAGVLPDKKLIEELLLVCRENKIPVQREVAPGVVTEGAFALFENEGIAVASVSIPTRYTHTPIECINLRDAEAVSLMLEKMILRMKETSAYGKSRIHIGIN